MITRTMKEKANQPPSEREISRWRLYAIGAVPLLSSAGISTLTAIFGDADNWFDRINFVLGLVLFITTLAIQGFLVFRSKQRKIAWRLYLDDIYDGICPDRVPNITPANAWKWYRKHGSPLRLDENRQRPHVRF